MYQFEQSTHSLPLTDIGQMMLDHQLYSQGLDFTSTFVKEFKKEGSSLMRRFWQGDTNVYGMEHFKTAHIVQIKNEDGPQGVVLWLRPDAEHLKEGVLIQEVPRHPVKIPKKGIMCAHLGSVMLFLKKEHRDKGLMKQACELLHPHLLEQAQLAKSNNLLPLLSCVDATSRLLAPVGLPIIDDLSCQPGKMSVGLRTCVMNFWYDKIFYPEEDQAWDEWLVPPKIIAPTTLPKKKKVLA